MTNIIIYQDQSDDMIAPEPKPLWSEFDLLSCSFALPPENGRHNRVTDLILFPHLDHEVENLNLRSLSWLSSRWTRRRRRRRVDSFPRSCSSKAGSGSSPRSRQTVSEKHTRFGIKASKMHSETSHLNVRGRWEKKERWWQWLYWWQLWRYINDDHHL